MISSPVYPQTTRFDHYFPVKFGDDQTLVVMMDAKRVVFQIQTCGGYENVADIGRRELLAMWVDNFSIFSALKFASYFHYFSKERIEHIMETALSYEKYFYEREIGCLN